MNQRIKSRNIIKLKRFTFFARTTFVYQAQKFWFVLVFCFYRSCVQNVLQFLFVGNVKRRFLAHSHQQLTFGTLPFNSNVIYALRRWWTIHIVSLSHYSWLLACFRCVVLSKLIEQTKAVFAKLPKASWFDDTKSSMDEHPWKHWNLL